MKEIRCLEMFGARNYGGELLCMVMSDWMISMTG